ESTVMVLSHIFYFPIIIISFLYPKKGVILSTLISLIYLVIIYSLVYSDLYGIVSATMQFYVYISVAVVVSIISDRIKSDRAKFRRIFDYSESGICVIESISGNILEKNNKYQQILKNWGLESTDNIASLCGGDAGCRKFLTSFDIENSIENHEMTISPDGKVTYYALISASKVPNGTIVITLSDITKEKEYANNIFELNKSLKKANNESNMYIDILAHDINNANTAAQGFAELLYETVSDDDRPYFEKMMSGIKQSSNIIDKVILIRDLHNMKETPGSCSLDDAIKNAAVKTGAKINYTALGFIVAGGKFLDSLFTCIFENSLAYGNKDVRIDVDSEEKDGIIEISIKDNGPGIPDSKKENLFLRFQPDGNSRKGRGLGLPLSWLIANRYGGDIQAENVNPDNYKDGLKIVLKLKKA
ncbi:MAG: HAMP domain-containing sensor histidine kinase, partial [Methanomicrobium sp.]|nr:HAMP domain-containing sensor histidine kinase [Methanomicrobium sp.]